MTRRILALPVLALGCCLLTTPMHNLQAQNAQPAKKFEKISKELNLTPQQKMQFIPILEQEGPKVEAIKNDASLQDIRQKEIETAVKKKMNQ